MTPAPMKITRNSDGFVYCDIIEYAKETVDMQLNILETSNNRTYVQPWGATELGFDITCLFTTQGETGVNTPARRIQLLKDMAKKVRMKFYYRDGNSYQVEAIQFNDDKDKEARAQEFYHLDLLLVRKDSNGFIT